MPLDKYFGGHGEEIMREMVAKHGEKAGKRIFYATVNARKKKEVMSKAARSVRKES